MNPKDRQHDTGIATITPIGRVDALSAPELRKSMDDSIDDGVRNLIIDLTDVEFLDSAGMAALVVGMKRTRQQGGDTKLVWPANPQICRIFLLTKFDKVFDFADTVSGAEELFGD